MITSDNGWWSPRLLFKRKPAPQRPDIRIIDGVGRSKDAHVYRPPERRPYCTAVIDALAVVGSYLLASISFPYWIARAKGVDLRAFGSRKLGGSNLAKAVTPLHGVAGGLLDGVKGFAAVVITRALGLPLETQLLCGLAAIAGQMWPIFHGFDGGRANATTWGFQLAADFIAFFIGWIPV